MFQLICLPTPPGGGYGIAFWYCISPWPRRRKYFGTPESHFGIVLSCLVLYCGFNVEAEAGELAVVCTV